MPRNAPPVDVLIAGPPCQGFSTLGRRDPSDFRNELGLAILPWVRACRPAVVVVENVPPFIRSPQGALLRSGLADLGFRSVETWELEASDYGTPQRRRRAFTVASRRRPLHAPEPMGTKAIAGAAFRPVPEGDPMHVWPVHGGVAAERIRLVPPNGDKRDIMRIRPDICPPSWMRMGTTATDVWGRIDPTRPANTLRCTFQNPSKGRYLHPEEDRVISLREGARLQGIPDSWILEGRPYPVARQIGNGVPIPLAEAVATAILEHFGIRCQERTAA